jgi:COP9 signalosome complex subunit 5
MTDTTIAQRNWELENNITTLDPEQDSLYFYDADQQSAIASQQPWKSEYVTPHHFQYLT